MAQRAVFFIDGSNWYHSLRRNRVGSPSELDYAAISRKLAGPREWIETRYYIGALPQSWDPRVYAEQRRFLSRLVSLDPRLTVRLGRLEPRPEPNPLAALLQGYVATAPDVGEEARTDLLALARAHQKVVTLKEKAVDIMLAVDLVRMAAENGFDAAYVLSADGDFTPAVEAVRAAGKTVYAASPDLGYALRNAVDTYIHLRKEWFRDCYRAN